MGQSSVSSFFYLLCIVAADIILYSCPASVKLIPLFDCCRHFDKKSDEIERRSGKLMNCGLFVGKKSWGKKKKKRSVH